MYLFSREERVHVSKICPVGGAMVFMREEVQRAWSAFICP